jgi:hypothetical protein
MRANRDAPAFDIRPRLLKRTVPEAFGHGLGTCLRGTGVPKTKRYEPRAVTFPPGDSRSSPFLGCRPGPTLDQWAVSSPARECWTQWGGRRCGADCPVRGVGGKGSTLSRESQSRANSAPPCEKRRAGRAGLAARVKRSRAASVEREFGRLKNERGLAPLRVRGLERVALHADLCILATLASALARARALPLAA